MQSCIVLKTLFGLCEIIGYHMVSVATFNSIVKNGGVPTLILISHKRVILDNTTWYQINANTKMFT